MADDKKTPTPAEQAKAAGVAALPVGTALTPELMKALGDAIAIGIAMAEQSKSATNLAVIQAAQTKMAENRARCETCLQLKIACKDKHAKMVVFPSDPIAQAVFDGVTINGVRYCSPNYSTQIDVPEANDIAGMLALFEKNERETRLGRKGGRAGGSWRNPNSGSQEFWR